MRKIIMVALSICAILGADASAAGKAKVPQDKAKVPQDIGNPVIQGKYFELLKSNIQSCHSWFLTEKDVNDTRYSAEVMMKSADNMSQGKGELVSGRDKFEIELKLSKNFGIKYKACINDAKATVMQGGAKEFVGAFASSQKPKAKALLAQWFTTMDAIGQGNFDQEVSKYDSYVNDLKVEAMVEGTEQPGLTKRKPFSPMPLHAEPDNYATQGWTCDVGFKQVNNDCVKQSE